MSLGYNIINTSDLRWNTTFFASKNENKLVSLIDDLDTLVYFQTNSGNINSQAKVGGGIGDLYGTVWERDSSGNRIVGADGKPQQSNPDNFLGNAQPDWLAGLTSSLSYKNLSLQFVIDGRFGGVVYSGDSSYADAYGTSERSLQYRESGVVLDAVDPNGAANTVSITGQEYWQRLADIAEPYVYEQDNVRLREIALGYSFGDVSSLGLESLNVQLIGRNLFFFNKKAEDIDPEAMLGTNVAGQGIALGNLPTLRSVGLNVTLKF
ncbi:MAG: hypothetical protein CM15mP22_1060 [Gammaproteobacteria bacterium]|nr:MAG: hypothetical protein CM15mP22_1060 [Gammaproteobacteria bacterium]